MESFANDECRQWKNGIELLDDIDRFNNTLSSGCAGIDLLLTGGFRKCQLTELVGPSSSGKTQICLQAASTVAMNHKGKVFFIDTGNSFSAKKISEYTCSRLDSSFNVGRTDFLKEIMGSIFCYHVYDIFALLSMLVQLQSCCRHQEKIDVPQLFIVDSLSSLISPVLGRGSPHGHALMSKVGYLLKKIAYENNLAVLVTNHMVSGEGGVIKPALGETWKSVAHVRLLLSNNNISSNTTNVSILKHPSLAYGTSTYVSIFD